MHLSLKGKFAKSGSVRKSRRYIIAGNSSRTSKNLGVFSKKLVIRTLTGVMGLKLSIFFINDSNIELSLFSNLFNCFN